MKTEIRLHFNCPKNLDELSKSSDGLFCQDCEKPVTDYSRLTKSEIIQEFRKHKEIPCTIVPADVLSGMKPGTTSFWTPFRKSAFFITLFILVGDMKSLLAQTRSQLSKPKPEGFEIPAGYQKVNISGLVQDENGKGIDHGKIEFYFFDEKLSESNIGMDGKFDCILENYGGIKEIDIKIKSDGYISKELTGIQILKESPVLQVSLKSDHAIHGFRDLYTMGGAMSCYAINEWRPKGTTRYGYFEETFSGLRFQTSDQWQEPTYVEKLHYPTHVIDEDGKPIANARVELNFSSLETRWGITNEKGDVTLHMHLNKPALHANIVVSAEGYHTKRSMFYEFDEHGVQIYRLKKKRQVIERQENEEPIIPDNAPIQVEVKQPEEEASAVRANMTDHVLLFPNPASENVTIQLVSSKNVIIRLMDISGHELLRKSSYHQSSILLDLKDYAPGNYVVLIQYDGKSFSEKLIVVR